MASLFHFRARSENIGACPGLARSLTARIKLDLPAHRAEDGLDPFTARPARPERLMNTKRLRFLARRHRAGLPHHSCPTGGLEPCDAALLAAEVARQRAWADFAYDLLDAHVWGFRAGDWQAGEALAHALEGDDDPPAWRRDPDDPAHIEIDPALWPDSAGHSH